MSPAQLHNLKREWLTLQSGSQFIRDPAIQRSTQNALMMMKKIMDEVESDARTVERLLDW